MREVDAIQPFVGLAYRQRLKLYWLMTIFFLIASLVNVPFSTCFAQKSYAVDIELPPDSFFPNPNPGNPYNSIVKVADSGFIVSTNVIKSNNNPYSNNPTSGSNLSYINTCKQVGWSKRFRLGVLFSNVLKSDNNTFYAILMLDGQGLLVLKFDALGTIIWSKILRLKNTDFRITKVKSITKKDGDIMIAAQYSEDKLYMPSKFISFYNISSKGSLL